VPNPRSRNSQIERLRGGSFDVLIIGSGVCETAIFASLASKGIPVALVATQDFASQTNQDIPFLLNDGFESTTGWAMANSYLNSKSINKLANSHIAGIQPIPYLSLVTESDNDSFSGSTRKAITNSLVNKGSRPQLRRQSSLAAAETSLRVSNIKGAIEHKAAYTPDGEGRLAFNLIHHGMSHGSNNAVAVNYLKPISKEQTKGKPWEIEVKDIISNEVFALSSKVVIEAQHPTSKNIFNLSKETSQTTVANTHISIQRFTKLKQFVRLVNTKNKKITLGTTHNRNMITCSRVMKTSSDLDRDADIKHILKTINSQYKLEEEITEDQITSIWETQSQHCATKSSENLTDTCLSGIKNQIEVDATQKIVNLVGTRVAASYQISKEVVKIVSRMGIEFKSDKNKWYSSSDQTEKSYFMDLAKNLDLIDPDSAFTLADCIWRRHRTNSFKILDIIESNETLKKPIIEGYDYIWAEIAAIRSHEMVVSVDDFLYRRTTLGQLLGKSIFDQINKSDLEQALMLESSSMKDPQSS